MKIALGSDHAGYDLKEQIKAYLKQRNIEVHDFGCDTKESVDYPDYAQLVAQSVSKGENNEGILVCGTGIGMSITANKIQGIRAALVHDSFGAKMSREHTNANILVLGAKFVKDEELNEIMDEWFTHKFEGGRHERRIDKIRKIEENKP